ncbi:hypothetical protein [Tateyamaria sp.]|uniref:hypothetical protein n=1 Tax=Tateyamaria sp. TaxID=1929288 RepID=UPI00329C442B
MPIPNAEAMEMGVAAVYIDAEGSLVLAHESPALTTKTSLTGSSWAWEAAYGVVPPPADWALANLGCINGEIPRWYAKFEIQGGTIVELELAMPDEFAIYGNLHTLSGSDTMKLENSRAVTFLAE